MALTMLVAAAVAACLLVFLLMLNRTRAQKQASSLLREPPNATAGLPVVGPLIAFSTTPRQFLTHAYKELGQTFTLDLLVSKITVIMGREGSKQFFEVPDQVLDFNKAIAVVAQNVLGTKGFADSEWLAKSPGYVAQGFMRHDKLNNYSLVIQEEVTKHMQQWFKEEKVDIFEVMSHLVTCINIRCILGEKAYKDHADEISRIYFQLENNAVNTFSMMFPNLPSPTKIKNEKARERLVEIITNLLTSDEGKEAKDYVAMIYQSEGDNHAIINYVVHGLGLMFGAHTNTAGTLGWVTAEWANDKALRDKARKEQEQLAAELGEEAEQMSSKFISQLNYMDACMKESVRKYSTLLLVRLAMQDVCFTTADGQEFLLPQGRTVAFSPFLTHYNEEIYPDPSRYDPERFTDLERKLFLTSNRHFVQFGAGVHKCPGERFANLVIKSTLSLVLRSSQFELVGAELQPPDYQKQAGTPSPVAPIWVRFRPTTTV